MLLLSQPKPMHPGFLLTFEDGFAVCKSPARPPPPLRFLGTPEGQLPSTEQVTKARNPTCQHSVTQPAVVSSGS